VQDSDDPKALLKTAERCRAVLKTETNVEIRRTLLQMARDYEDRAYGLLAQRPDKPLEKPD
jgi:hypothetical protein